MYTLVRRFIKTGVGFLGVGLLLGLDPRRIAAVYWTLTLATAARVVGEATRAFANGPWLRWLILAAGTTQAVAILAYFWGMWTRIRPVGSHIREAKGERF